MHGLRLLCRVKRPRTLEPSVVTSSLGVIGGSTMSSSLVHGLGCWVSWFRRQSGHEFWPACFVRKLQLNQFVAGLLRPVGLPANKSLQRTFDPPPIFADAKTGVASNAAELRR